MSYASYYSDKLLPGLSIKRTLWKICNKICSIVSKHEKSTAPAAPMSAKTVLLMRLQGLEPWTPWLRVRCSTNWAKSAYPSSEVITSATLLILPQKSLFVNNFFKFFLFFSIFFRVSFFLLAQHPFLTVARPLSSLSSSVSYLFLAKIYFASCI